MRKMSTDASTPDLPMSDPIAPPLAPPMSEADLEQESAEVPSDAEFAVETTALESPKPKTNRLQALFAKTAPVRQKIQAISLGTYRQVQPWAAKAWHEVTPQPTHPHRWKWGLLAATSGIIAGGAFWVESKLPDPHKVLTFARSGTITIKSLDGEILQQVGPATHKTIQLQSVPKFIASAFVAAEDRRFYQHWGVDVQGILRAMVANARSLGVVEGASTINQQVARIVFLNQERSAWRKLREMAIANKIDRELTKDQILEQYLNLVYLGSGAYGVADAAWVYFGKDVKQLTVPEVALLAGLAPAPSEYSPLVNPKYALERRNLVLERMQEIGALTAAEKEKAIATPVKLNPKQPQRLQNQAPYFTSYILKELPNFVSKDLVEAGGLTVQTTLNSKWQKYAERAVTETVRLDGPGQGFEQAALVAVDPQTGGIRAMVGGYDFNESQFNRVTQAQRQPGSTFKALLYATAMATGMSPYRTYVDSPIRVDGYEPRNASKKFSGTLSLADAIAASVNIVAVRTILDVGYQPVIKLSHEMGIESKLNPIPSLALGSSEVNLLELTSAYGTLAAQGQHAKAYGINEIRGLNGEVLFQAKPKLRRALDKTSAAITTWLLEGVVLSGTGQPAALSRPVAGKTGTSEEARDLLFVGYIPQLAAGVWLGNDNNDPTAGASTTAAATWHDFMRFAVQDMPVQPFPELPKLDGRKGSIKAQPVNPKSYIELPLPVEKPIPDPNNPQGDPQADSQGYGESQSGGGYYDADGTYHEYGQSAEADPNGGY